VQLSAFARQQCSHVAPCRATRSPVCARVQPTMHPWAGQPLALHHRAALLRALAVAFDEGCCAATGGARAELLSALPGFISRLLAFMAPDADLSAYGATVRHAGSFLRLAAASALINVAARLDPEVPVQAFVEMAMMTQDESTEVRRSHRLRPCQRLHCGRASRLACAAGCCAACCPKELVHTVEVVDGAVHPHHVLRTAL
jgi:hypothetical protein